MNMKHLLEITKLGIEIAKTTHGSTQNQEHQAERSKLRSELDTLRLQATVKEAAQIDAVARIIDPKSGQEALAIASAEAIRLRSLLLADSFNTSLRRMYLVTRTENEIRLDEEEGKSACSALIKTTDFAGFILGMIVGFFAGAKWGQAHILGIPVGTELKTYSWVAIFSGGIIAWIITHAISASSIRAQSMALWNEFGPIPSELQRRKSDVIRKRLF